MIYCCGSNEHRQLLMDSKITPPLINALLRSPNTDVVRIAAKMLGNIALTPGQREFAICEGAILK